MIWQNDWTWPLADGLFLMSNLQKQSARGRNSVEHSLLTRS